MPIPVAAIIAAAINSNDRREQRLPIMPTTIVAIADPNRVDVLTSPTARVDIPSARWYAGSSTAMNPSQKLRRLRAASSRHTPGATPASANLDEKRVMAEVIATTPARACAARLAYALRAGMAAWSLMDALSQFRMLNN